jgi:hypothetical protein
MCVGNTFIVFFYLLLLFASDRYTISCDVFSFGGLLYEITHATIPFAREADPFTVETVFALTTKVWTQRRGEGTFSTKMEIFLDWPLKIGVNPVPEFGTEFALVPNSGLWGRFLDQVQG